MLSFCGDHFVTLPLLRAHAKHFGKMALVHFDAHTDTYANGCEFDHGTMFYTAPKEGLIDPNHSVQIGIRTEFDKDNGFTVLDACQVNDRSVDDIIAQVKQIVGDMPVYLTFDIDCLDPAFAPGTGTPVIGGLTSDRAIKLVRGLKDLNIVGMDVVEVAPAYDQSELAAQAAAPLALAMQNLALAMGHRAHNSVQRTLLLSDDHFTGLSRFLASDTNQKGHAFGAIQKPQVALLADIRDLVNPVSLEGQPMA